MLTKQPKEIIRQPKVFNPENLTGKSKPDFGKIIFKISKWLFLILVILSIIYLLFYSPIFTVKNIVVDNDLPTSIGEHLTKYKGKNIFSLKSSEIKKDLLATFPELNDISVFRGLPDTIKITYKERKPSLIWETSSRLFLADENGIIYQEIQGGIDLPRIKDNKDLPISIGAEVVSANFIDFASQLSDKLKDIVELDHFEVNETTFQLDALTTENLKIKFDITRSVDEQLEALKKFLADRPNEAEEYIDLRVEGKVYFK